MESKGARLTARGTSCVRRDTSRRSRAWSRKRVCSSPIAILRISSAFGKPKVFFNPKAFAFALTSCIFISTPTVSKPLKHQKLYVIFFSDFSYLSRTTWSHQMIKCSRIVQKFISDAECHTGLVSASNNIMMLGDSEPSSGLQRRTLSTTCSYLNKSLFKSILL